MDFNQVILAHSQWKSRLRAFIGGNGEHLQAAQVRRDNECALGRWMYGEGAKYQADPTFQEVKQHHAKFHDCAAKVIEAAEKGGAASAEKLIAMDSEYASVSAKLVHTLVALQAKVR